jgi:hypothetical protein
MNKELNCVFWFVIIFISLCAITCCSSTPETTEIWACVGTCGEKEQVDDTWKEHKGSEQLRRQSYVGLE